MADKDRSGNLFTDGLEALASLFRHLRLWKASATSINLFSSGSDTGPFSVAAGVGSLVLVFSPDCFTDGVRAARAAGSSGNSSSSSIGTGKSRKIVVRRGLSQPDLAAGSSLGTRAYSGGPSETPQNHCMGTHLENLILWI